MKDICAQCAACSFMPEQKRERILSYYSDSREESPLVLVIDSDAGENETKARGMDTAQKIVAGTPFSYTTTIRCEDWADKISDENVNAALSHCSVWTNFLASDRSVILATPNAMQQLHLPQKYQEPGVLFKSKRLGLMLCIMPLWIATEREIKEYQTKTARLLKGAGIL
jgi:hypothetical protein